WTGVGATCGWITPDGLHFRLSGDRSAASLPCFQWAWRETQQRQLGKLIPPNRPFGIDVSRTPFNDDALKAVSRLQQLQVLQLAATRITDAGLGSLARLKQLRALDIGGTAVNGQGLSAISSLGTLRHLGLS